MKMQSHKPATLTSQRANPACAEQPSHDSGSRRPLLDAIEVRAPAAAALATRLVLRMPAPLRRRFLTGAFTRAEKAFNRADFEAIIGPWADGVEYVPPPALHTGPPIVGRAAVLQFWQDVPRRYERNRITNLSLEETSRNQFVRTAQLSHDGPAGTIQYVIRQTTDLRHGRVVRQVNEEL
jgi:SnoaL-like domain